ncbi:MAG: aldo/keto reductase [Erysipelotrichaceae bacterium]|nr:aldo/keto reductase [Erysipelotrichaceae bacterium]
MEFKPKKKLGFGLMRLPLNDEANTGDIDLEQAKKMVDIYMERGFTYFDTAWMYHSFQSEKAAKEILVDRYPRESYTLATKLHAGFFDSLEDRDKVLHQQLEKTGAGYFDYYLIHGIESIMLDKYEQYDCFRWVLEKKKEGLVKHAGFSFHDTPELLDQLLTKYPEMEFVQLQINYLDWTSPNIQAKKCYEVAKKHRKPVIVMEPVKGGSLAQIPQEGVDLFHALDPNASIPSWAIRFAASLDNVMVVLSGMSSLEQAEDNTTFMDDFQPLTDKEKDVCFQVAKIINDQTAIACTACHYCTDGCPMRIPIPEYFSLYNEDLRENLAEKGWTANYAHYKSLAKTRGKASDCVACGQCEGVCPQHLHIIDYLQDVKAHFEDRKKGLR